jgi:hypothetical protein
MKNLIFLCLLFLASCGGDNFRKVETLESFRILGIYSPTPEVAPGVGVTANLQLIVSDVKGGGRVINGTTQACIDPGIALGAKVSCDHDPLTQNGTYVIDTTTVDMTSNLFTGLNDDVETVNIPNTILLGRSGREQFNGVGFIVIFRFNVDGKEVTAFKRIAVTNRGSVNTNPTGSTVRVNGAPISTMPLDGDSLTITTSTPETYNFRNIDGTTENRTEEFQVAWYVSSGRFDKPKTDISDRVEYQGKSSGDPTVLLSIIRDERGGIDLVRRYFP